MSSKLQIKFQEFVDSFLRKHFFLKSAISVVLVSVIVQFPSIREVPDTTPNQALLEISHSIWTQVDYPKGSHLEKKTLRPFFPLVIRMLQISSPWQIYCILVLCNVALLTFFVFALIQITGDRTFSFYIGIAFSCVFSGCLGFIDTKGWGDVIPCLLILLALFFSHPAVVTPSFLFALLSDERSLLALPFIWLWHVFRTGNFEEFQVRQGIIQTVGVSLSLLVAVMTFLGIRYYMVSVLGFENKFTQVGWKVILMQDPGKLYLGMWSPFEAFWIFPFLLIRGSFMRGKHLFSIILACVMIGIIILSYSVHDITRSLSFLFPLFFLSVIYFYKSWDDKESAIRLSMLVALICLLCPTQNVYSKVTTFSPVIFHFHAIHGIFD